MQESRHHRLLAVAITLAILGALVMAAPTGAVKTTITGDDEVRQPDEATFTTSVDIREGERVPIESFTLEIASEGCEESVAIEFDHNGTVLSSEPQRGTVCGGDIRVNLLLRTLEITPMGQNADFGYGYGYGYDERSGESHTFGYGYGYGYGYGEGATFTFEIEVDSQALKQGSHTLQVSINTAEEDGLFASNKKTLDVLLPPGHVPPGPPTEINDDLDVDPNVLSPNWGGEWVTAYIELPEGDNLSDVALDTATLEGVPAETDPRYGFVSDPVPRDRDRDGQPELMVKFPRQPVVEALPAGPEVTANVTIEINGTNLAYTDTIRVIDPDRRGGGSGPGNNPGQGAGGP